MSLVHFSRWLNEINNIENTRMPDSSARSLLEQMMEESFTPFNQVHNNTKSLHFLEGVRSYHLAMDAISYHLGENHPIFINISLDYSELLLEASEIMAAQTFLEDALDVARTLNPNHPSVAIVYGRMSELFSDGKVKDMTQAIAMKEEMLKIIQKNNGPQSEKVADLLMDMSQLYSLQKYNFYSFIFNFNLIFLFFFNI